MWWMDGDEAVVRAGRWAPLVSFVGTFAITVVSCALLGVFLDMTWWSVVSISGLLAVLEAAATFGRRQRLDEAIDPDAPAEEQEAVLHATEGQVESLPPHLVGDARRLVDHERTAADRKHHRSLLVVAALAALSLLQAAWTQDLWRLVMIAPSLVALVGISRWMWSSRRRRLEASAAALDERFS